MTAFDKARAESLTDEDLLTGSVAQPMYFVTFYDRHARGLLAFFARRTYDGQVAADLTSETFAQAFAGRSRFKNSGPGGAVAWLYTIGRRQLMSFIKRQRVETRWRSGLGLATLPVAADAIERAEELIDAATMRAQVSQALDRLKPDLREAVVQRVIEGRSYAEAARVTGCSEQLLRQRVSRALKLLANDIAILREDHDSGI